MSSAAVHLDDALDLIADARAAACGMDRRHRVVYWNDGAASLLGWSAREALGRSCYELFAGRDVFGNVCCFRDCGVTVAVARGETPAPFVMELRRRDGAPVRLVTRTAALPSPGAAGACLVHLLENGNASVLDGLVARMRSAVEPRGPGPAPPPVPPSSLRLTPRELEVVRLLASGYGSLNIAARLGLSHATVRNHIQKLLRRLEVHSQVEAVSVAFRRGLLGWEEDGGDGRIRTDE